MVILTNRDVEQRAIDLAQRIHEFWGDSVSVKAMAIPRGGIPAAYMVKSVYPGVMLITDDPDEADIFIDDIIDSGKTRDKWINDYGIGFYALVDKPTEGITDWIVFPWEGTDTGSGEDIVIRLLQYIGEDVKRGGLIETPRRFLKAWDFWTEGYKEDPAECFTQFEDGAKGCDEMITLDGIWFYSHCEHHLAPFFGQIRIAYIPDKKIAGLSKFVRLVEIFARRLQVQERLTNQIADAIQKYLAPVGCAVQIKARHLCMESRGVQKPGVETTTTSLRGEMKTEPSAKAEFLNGR